MKRLKRPVSHHDRGRDKETDMETDRETEIEKEREKERERCLAHFEGRYARR